MLADFQGFTLLAERAEPAALIGLLDEYFRAFDDIVASHGLEKIKTIGDAYMAVGGMPETGLRHPIDACLAALAMQATAARMKSRSDELRLPSLDLRIGVHTGPVISGVVGNRRFAFDIWGDAVNTASFMEAHCRPAGSTSRTPWRGTPKRCSNWSRAVPSKPNTNARTRCFSSIA